LLIAGAVLGLAGCAAQSEPPEAPPAKSSAPAGQRPPAMAAKPGAQPAVPAAGKRPAPRLRDDFDLPLVIEIHPPEVPPEIQKPSPPIKEEPKRL